MSQPGTTELPYSAALILLPSYCCDDPIEAGAEGLDRHLIQRDRLHRGDLLADFGAAELAHLTLIRQRRAAWRKVGFAGVRPPFVSPARCSIRYAVRKDCAHQQNI